MFKGRVVFECRAADVDCVCSVNKMTPDVTIYTFQRKRCGCISIKKKKKKINN